MRLCKRGLLRIGFVSSSLLLLLSGTTVLGGSLEVHCVTGDGEPLRGVDVTLQLLPGGQVESKKTNKKGDVDFKTPETGIYRVWGRAEGYAPAFHEYIDVAEQPDARVTLTFQLGNSLDKLHFEDPAAAQASNDLLIAGIQAFQSGETETAVGKIEEALQVNPANPDAQFNLAVLYLQTRQLDNAEQALKDSVELLTAFAKIYAGTPSEAPIRQSLAKAEELLASMPMQHIGVEADQALVDKDYETAIAKYQQMIQMDPNNAVILYNLALAQTHANLLGEAKQNIARAIELKPGDIGFERLQKQIHELESQGISLRASEALEETQDLLAKNQYQEALDTVQGILQDVPQELLSGTWLLVARAQTGLENTDDAIAAYRKASELDKRFEQAGEEGAETLKANADRELANFFFERERYQEGLDAYIQALQKERAQTTQALADLGQTFSRQGKNQASALVFQKLLEVDPNFVEAYYELGMYHFYDLEQPDKAKELLEKYVKTGADPDHVSNAKNVLAVIAAKKK